MPLEFFDHTADIGVRVHARSLDDLFSEAAVALTTTICDVDDVRPDDERPIELAAPDLERLLVDWLDELLGWFDIEHWLPRSARVAVRQSEAGWLVGGTVRGEPVDPARHRVKVLVKAVTYHALSVTEDAEGWHATVVFDI